MEDSSGFESADSWHWCAALRRQQACGGAAMACSATGRNVPAQANNSRSLAVSRCMLCESKPLSVVKIDYNLLLRKRREPIFDCRLPIVDFRFSIFDC
jgi:hypothetical protein